MFFLLFSHKIYGHKVKIHWFKEKKIGKLVFTSRESKWPKLNPGMHVWTLTALGMKRINAEHLGDFLLKENFCT